MRSGFMQSYVTFQRTDNGMTWTDYYSCHAYINGMSGNEFFIANAGYDTTLAVDIMCRYCPELMAVIPTTFRCVDEKGVIYELTAPADNIQSKNRDIKFRGKRLYS